MAEIKTQIETLSAKLYDEIYNSTNDAKTAKMMADVFQNNVHNLWNTMIELSSVKDTGNITTSTTTQSPNTTTQSLNTTIQSPNTTTQSPSITIQSPSTTTQSLSTSQLHQICCKNYNGVIAKDNEKEKKEAYELRKKYNNKYKYLPMHNRPCSTTCNVDRYLRGIRKTNADLAPHSLLPRIKLIKFDYCQVSPQGSSSKDVDEIKNEENLNDSDRIV